MPTRSLTNHDYLMFAEGDGRGPLGHLDVLAMVNDPETWIEPTPVSDLFRCFRGLIGGEHALDVAAKALGPDGPYSSLKASDLLRRRGAELCVPAKDSGLKGLPLRAEFEEVLRTRAAREDFNPFMLPAPASFELEGEPTGLEVLAQRVENFKALRDRAMVFASYIAGSPGSFWPHGKASDEMMARAQDIIVRIDAARMKSEAAFDEAKSAADTQAAEEARLNAVRAREEADKARDAADRARQALADAEAKQRRAEQELEMARMMRPQPVRLVV